MILYQPVKLYIFVNAGTDQDKKDNDLKTENAECEFQQRG